MNVTLQIFDVSGRLVRVVLDSVVGPGANAARWDGREECGKQAASGVYFYRLDGDGFSQTRSLVMLR